MLLGRNLVDNDNKYYHIEDISLDATEWDQQMEKTNWQYDMHGYPVYESVVKVQDDLREEKLRNQHQDLKAAWEEYQTLLEKYKFWENFDEN